jgi:hypothetical protein
MKSIKNFVFICTLIISTLTLAKENIDVEELECTSIAEGMVHAVLEAYNEKNEFGLELILGGLASLKNKYNMLFHVHQNEHGGGYVDCAKVEFGRECSPHKILFLGYSCPQGE